MSSFAERMALPEDAARWSSPSADDDFAWDTTVEQTVERVRDLGTALGWLRRNDAEDARVKRLIEAGGAAVAVLAAKLAAGRLTQAQFVAQAEATLRDYYVDAAMDAGADEQDIEDAEIDDLLDPAGLLGFAGDIADGTASDAQIDVRALLWAGPAWAAYQYGKTVREGDIDYDWNLDPEAEHCDDCLANAEGGPYTRDTLPGYPGDGSTSCGSNCRCSLDPAEADTGGDVGE